MSAYFNEFQIALDATEASTFSELKAPDTGGDLLPFGHLEDRRFEILVYRLKYAELDSSGHRVTLMQGVGERGRDVIVHSRSGVLTQIIQCKNYSSRFTAPSLRKELLKLAFHHHVDPSVLGTGPVDYELWCPGGLTEQAATLLNTWPNGWTIPALREDALEVIETFAAFKHLVWDDIAERVVADFKAVVCPAPITGIEISTRARRCLPIYDTFFQGKVVMDRGDTFDAIRKIVSEATGFAQLTDKDAKHVLDRIVAFPQERRLAHMSGYVMGLSPELVSRFKRSEYEKFVTHAIQGTTGMVHVVLEVCARLVHDAAKDFRETVRPKSRSITVVFAKVLNTSMIARVCGMLVRGLKMQPGLEAYEKLTLRERLEQHTRELWDEYQRCLAGFDPDKHPRGSDEEFRSRIAIDGIDGASDQTEFESRLFAAIDQYWSDIDHRFDAFMTLVPKELLLIADTVSAFDNDWLFTRMVESTNLLQRLRGSAIIPE